MAAGAVLAPAAGAQTPSNDASLFSLSIESDIAQTRMFPKFDRDVDRYDVAVPSGETEVTVTVVLNDSGATVELSATRTGGGSNVELEPDSITGLYTLELRTDRYTYLSIDVTAEDGTEKPYNVRIDVASRDEKGWRVYNDVPMERLVVPMNRLVDEPQLPEHYIRGLWADDSRVLTTAQRHGTKDGEFYLDQKLYAFDAADSSRLPDEEFVLSGRPYAGIWSDGTTLWALDTDGTLRAYSRSDGSEISGLSTDVSRDGYYDTREVDAPRGIWSDGDTIWVVDRDNTKVVAFALPGPNCSNGNNYCRQSTNDFDLHADNDNPWGITAGKSSPTATEIDTWWVTNVTEDRTTGRTLDKRLFAYVYSEDSEINGTRIEARDIDLKETLNLTSWQQYFYGLAATDTIMYVAEYITNRVYSFNMPGVSGPVAPSLISSDATLSDLSLRTHMALSDTVLYDPFSSQQTQFSSGQTQYRVYVEPDDASMTVTATPNPSAQGAVVKVGGTIASNGVVALTAGTNGMPGVTTIKIVVTAQDGKTETYTVEVHRRAKSTDATLKGLELSGVPFVESGVPFTYDPSTFSYTPDAVANSVAETTVTATPNSEYAKSVVINGTDVTNANGALVVALDAQEVDDPVVNTITVVVTAEDGTTTKTYTVTVTRERAVSGNAMLKDLELTYGEETVQLVPMFDARLYSYEAAEVAYGVTSLVVKYELLDTNAGNVKIRFGGAKDANDVVADEEVVSNVDNPGMAEDTTASVDLSVGENTLTAEVTAENGIDKEAYEVSIDRAVASNDATLESLSVDPGTLDRDFYPELLSIDATVGHDDATTKLSIFRSDGDKATVVVKHGSTVERNVNQDDTVTGGTELTALTTDPLDPDALNYTVPLTAPTETEASETVVSIEVTAEDTTYKVYEVAITRPVEPDSDDVTLRTLTLTNPKNSSGVGLHPPFTAGTTTTHFVAGDANTQRVGNDVTQVVVVAEPTDADAQSVQLLVDGTDSADQAALAGGVTVDLAEPGISKVLSVKVTAEDGNSNATYVVTVTRDVTPLRGVTTLYSLVLRDLTQTPVTLDPEFMVGEENGTSFAASVDHGVTKVEVIATATDGSGATVEITGADPGGFVPFDIVGEKVITVVVTAQNLTDTETHTVTVTRKVAPADDNATLSSLTVGGEHVGLTSGTYDYDVGLLNGVDKTTVRAVATSANAEVTITFGDTSATGEVGEEWFASLIDAELKEGDNVITVVVTPENGTETDTKTYTVTVTRAESGSQPPVNSNLGTSNPGPYNPGTSNPGPYNPGGGSSNSGSSTVGESSGDGSDSDSESDDVTPLDDAGDAGTDTEAAINALHRLGVFTGTLCQSNRLCPNDPLQRWIAAVWLVRLIDGDDPPAVTESRFEDVNASSMWEESVWYAPHVERLADLEITVGCTQDPLNFCPDVNLTRAQVASWVARAFDLESGESQGFVDAVGSVHEANINAVVAAGVMSGCSTSPKNFCLTDTVTKGEMARYVYAARNVSLGLS